jgi:predicted alpha/beta-fold hydrolase
VVDSNSFVFRPYPGLRNPHVQTLAARSLRGTLRSTYSRIRISTADEDFIDLDMGDGIEAPRAICLILHGLEGCSGSGYVVSACRALARHGILGVAMNFRSCSGEPNRTLGSYHAGRTDDIRLVLDWLVARFPDSGRAVLGFSLGGNALLKYLGEVGEAARGQVDVAAAISVPFDLESSADAMERGLGQVYAHHFLRSLRGKAREKAGRFPGAFDLDAVESARTVRAFDEVVTAPIHGFRDVEHYYESCSSGRFLDRIRVRTLVIQSRDDPLVPGNTIPENFRGNGTVRTMITEYGGHVGFVARGRRLEPHFWAEAHAAQLIADGLAQHGT